MEDLRIPPHRRIGAWLVAGLTVGLAVACSSGPPAPAATASSLADRVARDRAEKDEAFRLSDASPIPQAQRATFPGLLYFPVDPSYNVPASIEEDRSRDPEIIELATSRDSFDRLARVGTITFRLAGATYTLTAFATAEEGLNRLFVPFGDLTNRHETYGGGRYLNLDRTATGLYDLDFNMAYNPYCVVRRQLHVSIASGREPSAGRHPRWRADAGKRIAPVRHGLTGAPSCDAASSAALLDEQHLAIGRQRPVLVRHDDLELVTDLAE